MRIGGSVSGRGDGAYNSSRTEPGEARVRAAGSSPAPLNWRGQRGVNSPNAI